MKLSKIRAAHTTRRLAGATIPRNGTASIGRGITLHRASGGRCEVDGKPAMARLDRPGRKRGGRVGKEEGGRISEDSKKYAAEKRKEASRAGTDAALHGITAGGLALGNMGLKAAGAGRFMRGFGHTATGLNAALVPMDLSKRRAALKEADRVEKGEAEPGEEDRKFGGRAKRKAKDNDGEDA